MCIQSHTTQRCRVSITVIVVLTLLWNLCLSDISCILRAKFVETRANIVLISANVSGTIRLKIVSRRPCQFE